MKKIKLLIAINCMNIGGAPTVVFETLRRIDTKRFDPYLLTLYPSKKANFFSRLDFLPPSHLNMIHLWRRSPFDIVGLYRIYRFLKEQQFDVVYTHLFLANTVVRLAAWCARVPVILAFEHSLYAQKNAWQRLVDRILAKKTNRILVSSQAVAAFTASQLSLPIDQFFVFPNPVFVSRLPPEMVRAKKQALGIEDTAFVVVTIGRFSEEKNQQALIRAAARLVPVMSTLVFLIVGHGPKITSLHHAVQQHDVTKQCLIIEDPEHAKDYFSLANLFVLPSLREGQSLVLYEAMLLGIPIIASDIPTLRETLDNGMCGILFPPDSDLILAQAIVQVMQEPDAAAARAARASTKLASYPEQSDIARLEQLCTKLLSHEN